MKLEWKEINEFDKEVKMTAKKISKKPVRQAPAKKVVRQAAAKKVVKHVPAKTVRIKPVSKTIEKGSAKKTPKNTVRLVKKVQTAEGWKQEQARGNQKKRSSK